MNAPKNPPKLPPGKTDLATELLDDPEFADIMGEPLKPEEIDDGGGDESEDDDD